MRAMLFLVFVLLLPTAYAEPWEEALGSGYTFLLQNVRFSHRQLPITTYSVLAAEPVLTPNGWEVLFRVTAQGYDRDVLFFVNPETYQVERMFLSKEVLVPGVA